MLGLFLSEEVRVGVGRSQSEYHLSIRVLSFSSNLLLMQTLESSSLWLMWLGSCPLCGRWRLSLLLLTSTGPPTGWCQSFGGSGGMGALSVPSSLPLSISLLLESISFEWWVRCSLPVATWHCLHLSARVIGKVASMSSKAPCYSEKTTGVGIQNKIKSLCQVSY